LYYEIGTGIPTDVCADADCGDVKGAITALVIAPATTIVAKMKRVAVVVTLALFLLWLLK
jgi:hypothetical protein